MPVILKPHSGGEMQQQTPGGTGANFVPMDAGMVLSPNEKLILSYVEHRPKAEAPEIAKALGLKSMAVQVCLRKMRQRWPNCRKALINPMRLGDLEFSFYFSFSTRNQALRERIVARLCASPAVIWLGALVGDFECGSVLAARRPSDIRRLIHDITAEFGEVFATKLISPRVHFIKYPRKYLGPAAVKAPRFELVESESSFALDPAGTKILGLLAQGDICSEREIARLSGLPFATVERRINAFEKAGVITGYYWDLPVEDFGREASQLLIECGGPSESLTADLRTFCDRQPAVTFLSECLGAADFEVGVEAAGARELRQLIDALQERFGSRIQRIRTLTEIEDRKLRHYSES